MEAKGFIGITLALTIQYLISVSIKQAFEHGMYKYSYSKRMPYYPRREIVVCL